MLFRDGRADQIKLEHSRKRPRREIELRNAIDVPNDEALQAFSLYLDSLYPDPDPQAGDGASR